MKFLHLFLSIIACLFAGIIGSMATFSSIPTWYSFLIKPPLTPPNWVFGPVWTILYILMGVALYFVWEKGIGKPKVRDAMIAFVAQLILNTLWSLVFFGIQSATSALFIIIGLWMILLATTIRFFGVSKFAGYLLMPYLFWVSFAAYLNTGIVLLNR